THVPCARADGVKSDIRDRRLAYTAAGAQGMRQPRRCNLVSGPRFVHGTPDYSLARAVNGLLPRATTAARGGIGLAPPESRVPARPGWGDSRPNARQTPML